MTISLDQLTVEFSSKPLMIGGAAMEYYGLRKVGDDIDFVVSDEDHKILELKYPDEIKDIYGDRGVCVCGLEFWDRICTFGYTYLCVGAIEEEQYLVISLEKLLFLKALAMKIPKCLTDLELTVDLVLKRAYNKI